MAGFGVYQSPRKMKDEDKWIRHLFTKTELIIIACGAFLAWLIYSLVGDSMGFVIGFLVFVITVVVAKFKIPPHMYMYGIGKPIYALIFLVLRRKIVGCLYAKYPCRQEVQ